MIVLSVKKELLLLFRVGFWKTQFKTEESFIERVEYISLVDGDPQTFTGGTDAKVWLNDNGYWTSYNINIRFLCSNKDIYVKYIED